MTRRQLIAVLAAAGLLAAGCATPVGVRRASERHIYETLTANALSTDEASVSSRQVALRLGLSEQLREDPESGLAELHARTLEEMDGDRLFALAEYSFIHARRVRSRAYFVAASIYAYAFLFPEDGSSAPDPLDPRLRTGVNLYNRAIAAALVSETGEVVLREREFPFHLGVLDLSIDPAGFEWADRRLANFVSAAELEVRGLRNRYRRNGLGAPFIADPLPVEGGATPGEKIPVAENVKVPVTFVLRYADARAALRRGRFPATLDLYSLEAATEIMVAGRRVPLEYETTSALAYGLEVSDIWSFALRGYLRGDSLSAGDGLFMMRPHVPGRVPVVLVHGTASSPARWAELLNELESDPKLSGRIEIWFFIYATGNPILYSASLLRESLRSAVLELGGTQRDPALDRMVVIGHSQGGLLAKAQVISSGDRFWRNLSDRPIGELDLKPETRELLDRAIFFEPLPFVRRVVFISTPHRGSFLAGNWLGRFASDLFRAPQNLMGTSLDLARAGISVAGDATRAGIDLATGDEDSKLRRQLDRVPSSVDNMDPENPFSRTISSIPVDPGVVAHSIIPVRGGPPPRGQNDGVVAYESAHIDEAASEYVVFHSGHSTQSHPETIEEVRRILLKDLDGAE